MNTKETIAILHIIKSLGRGGAETLLPETLSKHDKEKYKFHYIYFLPWKSQMVDAIKQEGGEVTCLPAKNNFFIMLQAFKIASYVKKNNIKLIHCHLPWAGIIGRIVGKITGTPIVYTEHNVWERYHSITYQANKLSFGSQKKVIAVSNEVADSIKTHYKRKEPSVQVVLNGINTDKFSVSHSSIKDVRKELNISPEAIVIGVTCVFRAQKRLPLWIEVAEALHRRFPQVAFIIAGDGVLKDEIFEKARELTTKDYVHFVGLQPEIRPYLEAMDIFMMTSEFEGLPLALLEAMSMGCMPACTAAGGIPELVKNNNNGILVPVHEPMQLVERLTHYLENPDQISKLGNAARETVVTSFSMQKMVTELETIYSNLLN